MEQYIKDLKKEYDEDYCIYLEKQLDIREYTIKTQQQEIDRLNKIIDELEKWCETQIDFLNDLSGISTYIDIIKEHKTMILTYKNILDKLQELKEID